MIVVVTTGSVEASTDAFRGTPGLEKGAVVRLTGFKHIKLKSAILDHAPTGRSHERSFAATHARPAPAQSYFAAE
jgi:hypothetical protein